MIMEEIVAVGMKVEALVVAAEILMIMLSRY